VRTLASTAASLEAVLSVTAEDTANALAAPPSPPPAAPGDQDAQQAARARQAAILADSIFAKMPKAPPNETVFSTTVKVPTAQELVYAGAVAVATPMFLSDTDISTMLSAATGVDIVTVTVIGTVVSVYGDGLSTDDLAVMLSTAFEAAHVSYSSSAGVTNFIVPRSVTVAEAALALSVQVGSVPPPLA